VKHQSALIGAALLNLTDLLLSRSEAIPKLVLLLLKSAGDIEESHLKLE
jgi:hypothetical protein